MIQNRQIYKKKQIEPLNFLKGITALVLLYSTPTPISSRLIEAIGQPENRMLNRWYVSEERK